jgi:putative ABC transport system permease protein
MAPRVMVVSEGMAKRLWPGREGLGQCVRLRADTMPCTTVVGIAEEIRERNIAGDSALFTYYVPAEQFAGNFGLALRTAGPAAHYADTIRRALQHEMPGASYVTVTPFSELISRRTQAWKLGATMFVAFGMLALMLAAVGLYATISYTVAQRTHEMGVRVALGAQARDVIALVVRDGVAISVVGLVVGTLGAFGASRWMAPLLFKESASDPWVFGAVTIALLAVAVMASLVPALRAARVDPQVALRAE